MQLSCLVRIRRFLFLGRWIWLGELNSCSCFLDAGCLHFDCKSVVTIKYVFEIYLTVHF